LQSKNYLVSLANTWILDSIPQNTVTDGLVLNLDALNKSSFTDNIPITNLQPYPTMLPSVTGSIIVSSATYDSNVGGSNWSWSYYPNSNISSDGGMEWHPDVIDPLGNKGAWLMKKRPGGNSESNWSTSPPGAIDETKDYVVSVWCKTNQANCFRIHINTTKNGSSYWGYVSSYHSGGGEWERLSVVVPKNSGNTSINVTRCQAIYTNITADAYYKYYQVEEGDTPTDFVDGTRSQNTIIYDLSGVGNNGTLTNGPTFNTNGWFDFDGVDDYIQLNQTITLTGEFTLNLFILPTSTNTKVLLGNNGTDYLQINNSSALGLFSSTQFITLNGYSWDISKPSMVTVTRNSSNTIQTYKNGSSSVTGSLTGDFRIRQVGQRGDSSRFYQGSIYTTQIYNRALSASEVLQNYYGGPTVTDGLVLAVDAGNLVSYESGSTTVYNMTGSINGTLTNGVKYNSNNGGHWEFDGVDDYITWGDNFDLVSSNISGFVWGKVNTLDDYTPWLDKLSGWGNYRFHSDVVGRLILGIRDSNNAYQQTITTNVLSIDTWYNIGFTFNNSTRESKIYLNGNLIHSNTFTIDRGDTTTDLQTGYQANNGGTLNGAVATLSLYDKVLTADEVLQNYNAQKSRFGL
jgi:hypothetical protein